MTTTVLTTLAGRLARRYPLMPFRGRLNRLRTPPERIPDGELVKTREGITVRVQPNGMYGDIYLWGDYEPYHTKIYRRLVRPGDTVLDVGANFGWFTTLFAQWTGPTGSVHAFEPVPFIRELTADTIALNGVAERVRLNEFGLGRRDGEFTVYTFEGLPHGHATAAGTLGRSDANAHQCEVRTLDAYCQAHDLRGADFMKVDVEGFEHDVFLGGEKLLASDRAPIVAFEINHDCMAARSLRPEQVFATLRSFRYTRFFTWTTRSGVTWLNDDALEHGDCIAAKECHVDRLLAAVRAGRLFR